MWWRVIRDTRTHAETGGDGLPLREAVRSDYTSGGHAVIDASGEQWAIPRGAVDDRTLSRTLHAANLDHYPPLCLTTTVITSDAVPDPATYPHGDHLALGGPARLVVPFLAATRRAPQLWQKKLSSPRVRH